MLDRQFIRPFPISPWLAMRAGSIVTIVPRPFRNPMLPGNRSCRLGLLAQHRQYRLPTLRYAQLTVFLLLDGIGGRHTYEG